MAYSRANRRELHGRSSNSKLLSAIKCEPPISKRKHAKLTRLQLRFLVVFISACWSWLSFLLLSRAGHRANPFRFGIFRQHSLVATYQEMRVVFSKPSI